MSKVIAVEYLTLDGVFEEPGWSGPYFGDELGSFQNDNLMEADALLLGRITYEGFSQAWPAMEEATGEFGVKMNSMPKWVATSTPDALEWNATALAGTAVDAVAALKADDATGTLLVNGSADLVNALSAAGLIDEYRFMVFPVVVGSGKKLWAEGTTAALELVKSQITSTGVAVLTYVPAAS
ncbi:pyrimidine reductase [Frondihabitans sucicola]|uniref:Pyrimidine reductase n=1 Tax=Frondihabitans sucicola TaxID=1268041 RepID=A0ABM8GHV5_9MICO|nr:dihydrofolate reductase family protein [Frondihabitans sucicola]BDZ47945.1 pyrimidine reductase [Frondihabitans sucicola]